MISEALIRCFPITAEMIAVAQQNHEEYKKGNPFPHIVIDNFFPEEILDAVLQEFPSPTQAEWKTYNSNTEKKLELKNEDNWGPATKVFFHFLNSRPVLDFLSELSGIPDLISDPYYAGGGLHQIVRGGVLKIHADFNIHPRMKLSRRLNLLIYLNKDWKEEYRGHLELWDKEMKYCVKKILPVFNRMVVFSTDTFSYHGHPDELTCPEDRTRKSLALYYYTNGRPEGEVVEGLESHGTLFQLRATEDREIIKEKKKRSLKSILKLFVPPIIGTIVRKMRR